MEGVVPHAKIVAGPGTAPFAFRHSQHLLVEALLATAYVTICLAICWSAGLPVNLPQSSTIEFTGMSNLVPTAAVIGVLVLIFCCNRSAHPLYMATALLAYAAILIMHFNLKLGIYMINPTNFDALFWEIDRSLYPLVDGAIWVHDSLEQTNLPIDRFYLFLFLAMFVSSIVVHGARSFVVLRKVVLASMLVHIIGGFFYLAMPALGPFIYETGVNGLETARQFHMLEVNEASRSGGAAWFEAYGPGHLATGLAAMPSLHVASSSVFVYFAWCHERHLLWLYIPLFSFIVIEAIASHWHYLVDIPGGLVVTAAAVAVSQFLVDGSHALRHVGPSGASLKQVSSGS